MRFSYVSLRLRRMAVALGRLFLGGLAAAKRRVARARKRLWAALTSEPSESPLPDVLQMAFEEPSLLLPHLNALRRHLLRAAIFWVVMTALALAFTPRFIAFLAAPIGGIRHLQAIDVTEPVLVYMRVALLLGFAVSLPYFYFELFMFVAPGLRPKARIFGLLAMPLVLVFFVAGMAFAYYVMLPAALPFLLNFMGVPTVPRPASYINFVTSLLFWIGVTFEFPLAIYIFAAFGWVRAEHLLRHWRVAVVLIAVFAAVITPTVDPVNMLLVMAPMLVLYFLSIGLAKLAEGGKSPQSRKEG